MTNKELFEQVRRLSLPRGEYALFGSAPLGIRNLKECHDVDIVVTEDLWEKCKNSPDWQFGKAASGSDRLFMGDIELFRDWKPEAWDVNKLIREADIVDGLPFVKLEDVVKWKKLRGKEKDLKDIELIENYIRNNK